MKRVLVTLAMSLVAIVLVVTEPVPAVAQVSSNFCLGWDCSDDRQCQISDPEEGTCHAWCWPVVDGNQCDKP